MACGISVLSALPAAAAEVPFVRITSSYGDKPISGEFLITAVARPVKRWTVGLATWCLLIDGRPVSTDVLTSTLGYTDLYDKGRGTFSTDTGCWSRNPYLAGPSDDPKTAVFRIDSTKWADGVHTFQVTVTDSSNRTGSSQVISSSFSNRGPSASFVSPQEGASVEGVFVVTAVGSTDPQGTAELVKWCLELDGDPIPANVATPADGFGELWANGVFSVATGCWTATGSTAINTAAFRFDSTAVPNEAHTFQVTVTDSSGRTGTSSLLTLNTVDVGPAVSFAAPGSGATVSGEFVLKAVATPSSRGTAKVVKWCLSVDGSPVSSDVLTSASGFSNLWDYGRGMFDVPTGCWTRNPYYSGGGWVLNTAAFGFDSTKWADGQHTFQVTVTDSSGRTSTSPVLSVSNANVGPAVSFAAPGSGATVSGEFVLKAVATPSSRGTAKVVKWCLSVDGSPVSSDVLTSASGFSNLYEYGRGTFDVPTGCWTRNPYYSGGGWVLNTAAFRFDSTTWADGQHSFQLTVTDSSGRTGTSPVLALTSASGQPADVNPAVALWSHASGSVVSGEFTLKAGARAAGDAKVVKWCLSVDGAPVATNVIVSANTGYDVAYYATFSAATGCWSANSDRDLLDAAFGLDSTGWADGTHTFQVTVTDSSNRTGTTPVLSLDSMNAGPAVRFWLPGSGSSGTGAVSLVATASADPTGTAVIARWCLTVDGSPATAPELDASGCGASSTLSKKLLATIDTTTWPDAVHVYRATVTDSFGRTASQEFAVGNVNRPISVTVGTVGDGATVAGDLDLVVAGAVPVPQIGLRAAAACLRLDGGGCIAGGDATGTTVINTAGIPNGVHVLTGTFTDTVGRTATTGVSFTIANPAPTIQRLAKSVDRASVSSKVAGISMYVGTNAATRVLVRWGTRKGKYTGSELFSVSSGDAAEIPIDISGFTYGKRYYFEVSSLSANGSSARKTFSLTMPRKPYLKSRRCRSRWEWYLFSGIVNFYRWTEYRWSTGETTYSNERPGRC